MTEIRTIHPTELAKAMCADCYVLDVRTSLEFKEVRLQKNSVHMPLDQLDVEKLRSVFTDQTKPVYIVCKGGVRATKAAVFLREAGFKNPVVVDGGLDACVTCGLDVLRANSISLERQVRMAAGALVVLGVMGGAYVNPSFYILSALVGLGLFASGLTGWCGLALLLAKAPWNK